MIGISVVVNVVAEEVPLLPRLLNSVIGLAEEIVIVDMTDDDPNLKAIAQKYNANIFSHKRVAIVETARNFGIGRAKGNWILILDPDEEIPKTLAARLKKVVVEPKGDYYRIPRKNIIFNKWMQHSRWWPDLNIRFFKKGHVLWTEAIHAIPVTKGIGMDLKVKEENAIAHYNYQSINQYLARMDRYTSVQAEEVLRKKNYKFIWMDLIQRPTGEFLSRYFAGEGYKDGLHGLAIALLQAFSEVVLYLKVWEKEKFLEQANTPAEIAREFGRAQAETSWWLNDMLIKNKNFVAALPNRLKRKILEKRNG